jgi:LysM repeat protein
MKTKLVFAGIVCSLAALLLAGFASAAPAPQADGPNLLVNPGFESPYFKQCCHTEPIYLPGTPIDEVQVANGWSAWWLQPDLDPAHPGSCERMPASCVAWHRPEWRDANCGAACADRYRSGDNAQKYFTFWSLHDAGMYQQVSGIRPGTPLRFSIYMEAWSTNNGYGPSDPAQSMNMQVGIDPTGGLSAFSPNVIWSAPQDSFDAWGYYAIEAVAKASTVTVFTRSRPVYAIQHDDVYLDDASLVVIGGGGQQPASPSSPSAAGSPNSPAAAPTARPTAAGNIVQPEKLPTPAADGKIYYVIRSGDTLTHIAVRFGTTVAHLKLLNGWTGNVIIYTGQKMIIGP